MKRQSSRLGKLASIHKLYVNLPLISRTEYICWMPRARNQYIEEMRERFEVVNVAGRRVDRKFQASNEEKATLTGAEQVN